MSPKSVSILFAACIALAACASTAPSPAAPPGATLGPLDGTTYDVTLAFPNQTPMKDTIRFREGRFESTACTAVGFPQWADYRANAEAGAIAFAVVTRNPDGTTMDWKGSVQGDVVEGTATRTQTGGSSTAVVRGARH